MAGVALLIFANCLTISGFNPIVADFDAGSLAP